MPFTKYKLIGEISLPSSPVANEHAFVSEKPQPKSLARYYFVASGLLAVILLSYFSSPVIHSLHLQQSLDQQLCGQDACRFLLVSAIGEGESRAIVHLSQTARLAKELNRTLVLPNVHLGLLHVCYTTPWSAYYDIEWYEEKFGVHAITFDQYTNWVAAQQLQPTGAYVVAAKERVDNGTIARTFVINSSTLESTCDDKAPLDYSPFPDEIEMKPPRGFDHDEELAEEFGHRLLKELPAFVQHTDDSGLVMEPDVISIEWHFALPLWPFPGSDSLAVGAYPVRYCLKLQQQTDDLFSKLYPYIAVHWRMETADPKYFMNCAQSLHEVIANISSEHGDVRNVFLLTDYPIEDESQRHSPTFTDITDVHREAVKYFVDNLGLATNGVKLNTLAGLLPTMHDLTSDRELPLHEIDLGLLGMLDRSIASKGQVFLAGSPRVCARYSSMTAQIVDGRRQQMSEHDESIWNDVGYFVTPQRKSSITY